MYQFIKTNVPDFITVQAFISVLHANRSGDSPNEGGESHAAWEFLHLEQGALNVLVDGELYHLQPGQLILYPPHSFHSIAFSQDAVFDIVCFTASGNGLWEFSGNILTPRRQQLVMLSQIIALGKQQFVLPAKGTNIRGMSLRQDVPAWQLQKLSALLTLFLINLYESDAAEQRLIKPIPSNTNNYRKEQLQVLTDYLKSNLSCNLTLEQISAACSISIPSLHKLCRSQCGCGPITYFISLKLGAAKRLMQESSLNFSQIAAQLGFSSVHYFSRLFKAKTGMSPSQYARSINRR